MPRGRHPDRHRARRGLGLGRGAAPFRHDDVQGDAAAGDRLRRAGLPGLGAHRARLAACRGACRRRRATRASAARRSIPDSIATWYINGQPPARGPDLPQPRSGEDVPHPAAEGPRRVLQGRDRPGDRRQVERARRHDDAGGSGRATRASGSRRRPPTITATTSSRCRRRRRPGRPTRCSTSSRPASRRGRRARRWPRSVRRTRSTGTSSSRRRSWPTRICTPTTPIRTSCRCRSSGCCRRRTRSRCAAASIRTARRRRRRRRADEHRRHDRALDRGSLGQHGRRGSTATIAGFGSGLTVPGYGIILHNRGGLFTLDPKSPNAIAPHKRPFNTLSAGFVMQNNRPLMTVTLMGGDMQAQGIAQVLRQRARPRREPAGRDRHGPLPPQPGAERAEPRVAALRPRRRAAEGDGAHRRVDRRRGRWAATRPSCSRPTRARRPRPATRCSRSRASIARDRTTARTGKQSGTDAGADIPAMKRASVALLFVLIVRRSWRRRRRLAGWRVPCSTTAARVLPGVTVTLTNDLTDQTQDHHDH